MREGWRSAKKNERGMTMVLVFEEEVMRVICAYGLRAESEKDQFYNEMACKWDLQNCSEIVL